VEIKEMGINTFNNGKEIIFTFTLTATGTPTFSGTLRTLVGQNVEVFWGDGTSNTYTGATDQAFSHVYAAGTFVVNFVAVNKTVLTKFASAASTGTSIAFDLKVLPVGITYLTVLGANIITGNIADIPRNTTYFDIRGSNTITGNTSYIPSTTVAFTCLGSNTITGSLSSVSISIIFLSITGSNTINSYTYPKTWASTTNKILLNGSTNLSAALNDQVLIDLNNAVTTWAGEKIVYLKGTRTSASDAAVTALTAKGVTVTPLLAS
jgi:hypothetical protein